MMEKREFYEIKSINLYSESINFLRANKSNREKRAEMQEGISDFITRTYTHPAHYNASDLYTINGENVYLNNIVPQYMVLEKRDGKLYELLTGYEVTSYDNYFKGVGVFAKGVEYDFGCESWDHITDINKLIRRIDEAKIVESYKNYDTDKVAELFKKFVSKAHAEMQNKKSILDEKNRQHEEQIEQGKQLIKKYTK